MSFDVKSQPIAGKARPPEEQTQGISNTAASTSAGTSPGQEPEKPDGSVVITLDSDTQEALQFADTAARNGFVKKVFGLVSLQLLVTVGIICNCIIVPPLTQYLKTSGWPFWVLLALMMVVFIVIIAADKARQMWPYDMIMLMTFTLVVGMLLGTLSALYSLQGVLIALGITSVIVICITVFAFNTKVDATECGVMLAVLSLTFVTLVVAGIVWHTKWWQLLLSGLGSVLFTAHMLHDIQLIMGGEHKRYSINADEYIFAALILYMDVVNLFLWILGGGAAANS